MSQFRKKPVVIEAITFDELITYGIACGANVVNGMPWSFSYQKQPITHENDNCYLIPTLEGLMRFERGDMLITDVKGEIYPCKPDIFAATYEPVTRSLLGDYQVAAVTLRALVEKIAREHVAHGQLEPLLEALAPVCDAQDAELVRLREELATAENRTVAAEMTARAKTLRLDAVEVKLTTAHAQIAEVKQQMLKMLPGQWAGADVMQALASRLTAVQATLKTT